MKRFFCRICQKVKRTQQWPQLVDSVNSINVFDRVGECNWHSGYVPRIIKTEGKSFKKVKPVKIEQVSKRRKAS